MKCDMWSFGCTLYEICMLEKPFDNSTVEDTGTNYQRLKYDITHGNYEPMDDDYYSDNICNLISKLLSQDPYKRPSAEYILQMPFIRKFIQ